MTAGLIVPSLKRCPGSLATSVCDPRLEIPRGTMTGQYSVNKFGRTINADSGVRTDVWDAAAQPVWLSPTAARIHAIVSTDDNDGKTGSPNATGARTIRIYGLQTWDSAETSEDKTLTGTDSVNTANAYVIIHRMKVLTSGASGPNIGLITATAAGDATVTAVITASAGQTLMAVYGVPSTQTAYLTQFYSAVERDSPQGADVELQLLWTPDVASQPKVFITKHTWPNGEADGLHSHAYNPYNKFTGPGILKIAGTSDADDTHIDAGFDMILVDN